jgi:hypothetical protein
MPNYSSLETQVTAIKNEISSSLAASAYSAQDLVYVAKALQALGTVVAPDGVSNITITDNIYLGSTAESFASTASLTNPTFVTEVDNDNYAQIAFRNKNAGSSASTDIILYSNNGNDGSGYIDMGITSSNFSDPAFTATGKGDGYIFMVGADSGTTDRGNLVLATDDTGTQNKIIFAAGGLASNNTQMTITPNVDVHIAIATPSTSPTTGALTVAGGVGIVGDVNIQGAISFGGAGTTVTSANLSVADSMIFSGDSNAADILDLGYVGKYVSSGTKYAGVVRDASDGIFKFFKGATTKPSTTVNFSEVGVGYADLQVGGLTAASATIGSVTNTEIGYLSGVTSSIQTQIGTKLASSTAASTYAPISNPTLTGTPAAPTAAADTNTTQLATTAYVVGQGYLKSATASSTYAALTGAQLIRPNLTTATETVTVSATAATGTVNVDLVTSAVKYYTSNASADWTFNFRGDGSTALNSLLSNGQSATVAFLVTNGSTAYKPTVFQVDGSAVTPKWQGGTAPAAGNASSIDAYTFTIIKTASATFTVLGAQTKFA